MIGTVLVGTIGYTWALFHIVLVVASLRLSFRAALVDDKRWCRASARAAMLNAAVALVLAALTKWATGL